jgi:hypothetical protein
MTAPLRTPGNEWACELIHRAGPFVSCSDYH